MSISTEFPSVTVAIPALNEENFISDVIDVFSTSQYPNIIEIIVADGGSTDKTKTIVKKWGLKDERVKLIDNPGKIQSIGLNKILEKTNGEIFLRADAHCIYAENYVEKCIEALKKSQALNVGGAQRFMAENNFQAGIAMATLSNLGSGGAHYRDPHYTGYSDTVFLGCFITEALKEAGGFSNAHETNEDAEMNLKLNKLKKNAVYVDSNIKVWYYPRNNVKDFIKQYFRYGCGRAKTTIQHSIKPNFRGNIPFIIFWFFGAFLLVESIAYHSFTLSLLILTGLLAMSVFESLKVNIKYHHYFKNNIWVLADNEKPNIFSRFINTFIILWTAPLSHAIGYSWQVLKNIFKV